MRALHVLVWGAFSSGLALHAAPSQAQGRPECAGGSQPQGVVVAVDGDVTVRRQGSEPFDISVGTTLCERDEIVTGMRSRVEFRLAGKDTTTGSSSNAVTVIPGPESECVGLLGGVLSFISSVRGTHCIRTPFIDAGIDGTEALVAVDPATGDSFVLVRTGVVTVVDRRDPGARLALTARRVDDRAAAFATRTQQLTVAAPENVPPKFRDLLLRPERATDWAIYYPPILLGTGIDDPAVLEAAALLDGGEPDAAEALLAGARLDGRAAAAALSLRAVAAIFRNDTGAGLALADEAVALDPALGAAHIAQGYALQSAGRLDAAVAAAEAAVKVAPDDAYAWARLAELRLTVGDSRGAADAVGRSLAVMETALGRTIEGFSALARSDFAAAGTAFERAIAIDSEAPLPRLGLGLAAIRQGRVAEGRLEMETAVALDPRRASLRTWLGRAYFEEELTAEAAAQFALAIEGDPDDPNPWLFEAVRLAAGNRPVDALRAVETSRDLVGGRAALRSDEGLGEDSAARSVALGRIYRVLGFEQLATQSAAEAVQQSPTSPEAHRFLADAYRGRPGFEIAQTSELLRYQLLLPPTADPVQASLAEAALGTLAVPGPTDVTFHEFAPLFRTDGFNVFSSVLFGNNGTFGDEVAFSVLHDNVSLSVGQYHFQTDGTRANDDVEHDVVAMLAKFAPAPEVTLTAEARLRSTDEGDRFLRAVIDPTGSVTRSDLDRGLFRIGAHAEVGPATEILAAGTFARLDAEIGQSFPLPFLDFSTRDVSESWNVEVQGMHRLAFADLVAGMSLTESESDGEAIDFFGSTPFATQSDHLSVYGYATVAPFDEVAVTLGVSHESASNVFSAAGLGAPQRTDASQINPKLGLTVEPIDGVRLRAAYFRTLKRAFVADQTLEPTTIAGFNQFYDDFDLTDATTIGAGVDLRPLDNVWVGGEFMFRDLETPSTDIDAFGNVVPVTLEGTERTVRGYVNATLGSDWALRLGVERTDIDSDVLGRPTGVTTLLVPASAAYFHPSGFFASAEAIWFDQSTRGRSAGFFGGAVPDTDENGVVVNAALGYRLPRNRGVLSLEVNNLLDASFLLENSLVNSARPATRPLAEEFSIVGRATFAF